MIKLTQALTAQHVAEMWPERATMFLESDLDLSLVNHIDSAGVAFLVKWAQSLQSQQQQLKLTGVPSELFRLIQLYGVARLFDIHPQ